MITSRSLNPNSTAGQVSKPSFDGGMPDTMIQAGGDVANSEANGEANVTASTSNLSAKFKYPSKSQDAGAGANQWNTPQ